MSQRSRRSVPHWIVASTSTGNLRAEFIAGAEEDSRRRLGRAR
jgi:hypothetical protein